MATISGFSIIPVLYNSTTTHYLYARPHQSPKGKDKHKESDAAASSLPDGRTLFLVNVPPDATERELVLFFKHAGMVERVVFDSEGRNVQDEVVEDEEEEPEGDEDAGDEEKDTAESTKRGKKRKGDTESIPKVIPLPIPSPPLRRLRRTGRTAHIVFLDASSFERALASTSKPRPWPSSSSTEEEPHGIAHYTALYASLRPSLDSIRAFADSSMAVYEYNLEKEKQKVKYKKGEAIVDEDGFTLVTRGGAYGKTLGGGVGVASKKFQRSVREPRKRGVKKEKEGFYAFQKAEKQRSNLLELRRKWEEDKAKVEKLKSSRRFKPY